MPTNKVATESIQHCDTNSDIDMWHRSGQGYNMRIGDITTMQRYHRQQSQLARQQDEDAIVHRQPGDDGADYAVWGL